MRWTKIRHGKEKTRQRVGGNLPKADDAEWTKNSQSNTYKQVLLQMILVSYSSDPSQQSRKRKIRTNDSLPSFKTYHRHHHQHDAKVSMYQRNLYFHRRIVHLDMRMCLVHQFHLKDLSGEKSSRMMVFDLPRQSQ